LSLNFFAFIKPEVKEKGNVCDKLPGQLKAKVEGIPKTICDCLLGPLPTQTKYVDPIRGSSRNQSSQGAEDVQTPKIR